MSQIELNERSGLLLYLSKFAVAFLAVLYLSLSLAIPVYLYVGRVLWQFAINKGPWGFAAFIIFEFAGLYLGILLCLCFLFFVSAPYTLIRTKKYKTILLFIALFAIALLLPVDTLTGGGHYFHEHRETFEARVALARQHRLVHYGGSYTSGVVSYDPLTVVFNAYLNDPIDAPNSYEYTIYTENSDALKCILVCNGDGYIHGQLDKNWWTCFMDWN